MNQFHIQLLPITSASPASYFAHITRRPHTRHGKSRSHQYCTVYITWVLHTHTHSVELLCTNAAGHRNVRLRVYRYRIERSGSISATVSLRVETVSFQILCYILPRILFSASGVGTGQEIIRLSPLSHPVNLPYSTRSCLSPNVTVGFRHQRGSSGVE